MPGTRIGLNPVRNYYQKLRLDAAELKKLLESAERQKVKDILTVELRKLETEISLKQDAVKSNSDPETTGQSLKSSTTQTRVPTVDVKNYAWDQSEKFMKIYATVPGVESVPKEQVTCNFSSRSFSLRCNSVNQKNYTCEVTTLMEEILPNDSYIKVNILKSIDKDADPNDSMMSLMKQMYEDGDDEMKRTIAKAWTESREKKPDMAL
ncbi:calcyclin-binding protein-like [Ruditapes philippinarum]|uniref:calcyclin-binding protein-like n=1 Tax=Ruditapes philippinarum TaxID=129788 RepID=UPI00295B34AE|nr:calcyclin-binding protein-like [Ruditapes philippinarum]